MWRSDTKLEEMTLPEERVLEKLDAVSTAKRLANMVRILSFMHDRLNGLNLISGTPRYQVWDQGGDPKGESGGIRIFNGAVMTT